MAEIIKNANVDLQAIILAGGRGSRMGDYTREHQKCMLEVDGAPIIQHILSGLRDTFGTRLEIIIATGYRGSEIKSYFGDTYEGMKLVYVHDERPLETRGRMMLAKDLLVKPFLFLAGDILTPNSILTQLVARFESEKRKNNSTVGVISGAKDHSPALSHAVLTVSNGFLQNIVYPPPMEYNSEDLRESHRAIYSLDFLEMACQSNEKLLSKVIKEIIAETNKNFGIESFSGTWGHYITPTDLERYKDLPFLKKGGRVLYEDR